jgi:hypothetical protein
MGGLNDKIMDGANALRPNQRNPEPKYGRPVLDLAQGNQMVGDHGAPNGWPAQSPASAQFTPGLPGEGQSKKKDPGDSTIQPGIRRP